MDSKDNITVTIKGGRKTVTVEQLPSRKETVTVNAIRLPVDKLQKLAAPFSLADYLDCCFPEDLLDLRAQQPITFENDVAVVVPHANAKEIAKDGKSALIASALDQKILSFEFFQKASGSGAKIKDFFNAIAQGMNKTGLSLNRAVIIINIRMKDSSHIVAPQPYPHAHITDDENVAEHFKAQRPHVPHPKGPLQPEACILPLTADGLEFEMEKVSAEHSESVGHHVMKTSKPWAELMVSGTAKEWDQWGSTWTTHAVAEYAKNKGMRISLESGVMSFHGDEPLYQGKEPTRWSEKIPENDLN